MSFALEQFSTVTDSDDFLRVPLPILTQYLSDDNINAAREEQIFQVGLKVPGVDIFFDLELESFACPSHMEMRGLIHVKYLNFYINFYKFSRS